MSTPTATPPGHGAASARAYANRGLFSDSLLDDRLGALPRGGDDASAWARARAAWAEVRERVGAMDRAEVERAWVQPILVEALGWKIAGEPASADAADRGHRPRWRLLAEGAPAAVADAAPWAQPLDAGDASTVAPSFRAAASLAAAGAGWAILTSGREWRLYADRTGTG